MRRKLTAEEITALWSCPAMPVRKAEQAACISHNKIYRLMKSGDLAFVKLGRLTLVNTASLRKLVMEGLPSAQ